VGGLAVSVRAEPRFTRDLDLAVAVASDLEAEELVRSLMSRGWRVLSQVEQDATERFATARLAAPEDSVPEGVVVDLLFASSGIEPEIVRSAEPLEVFADLVVPVVTRAHLLALKILSRNDATRPQDRGDALALWARAEPGEVEQARSALARISALGFHRGKDLIRELDDLIGGSA
jgi:hypothetical protein